MQDAFSESNGYTEPVVDGMVLRDQVFPRVHLRTDHFVDSPSRAESEGTRDLFHEIRLATPEDQTRLLAIWLASVRATHKFLTKVEIQALMPSTKAYLTSPDHALWVLCEASIPIGFMGLDSSSIEAHFIDQDRLRCGGGRALVAHARTLSCGRLSVDVNEQNFDAVSFYGALSFVVVGKSSVDDQGRPY